MRLNLADVVITPTTYTGIFHVSIKGESVGRAVVNLRVVQKEKSAVTTLEWSLFILESKNILKADNLLTCVHDFLFQNPDWLKRTTLQRTPNEN